ncbi:MAG: hypothetical protein V2A34_15925, partial [Lentisphaerota bacterium]
MGQAKKKRLCPAVGREVGSAECGAHRASSYTCAEVCESNPWAPDHYDQALGIEDRLGKKLGDRLSTDGSSAGRPPTSSLELEAQQFFLREILLNRDLSGRSFVDRWAAEGFKGLNNDERFLLGRQALMRPAVVEVRRILSDEECEAIDLLDPQAAPFVVHDRSLAARAVRFSVLLGLVYDMPHYRRMFGMALELPSVGILASVAVVRETARHLGGPDETEALRGWLFANYVRMGQAFQAIDLAMRKQLLVNASFDYTKTAYRLKCSPEDFVSVMKR